MPGNHIRTEYDQLTAAANTFARESQQTEDMTNTVGDCVNRLYSNDWKGRGGTAFATEMSETVIPALDRLGTALSNASAVAKDIINEFKQAEEEAEKQFQ